MKRLILLGIILFINSFLFAGRYAGDFLEIGTGVSALGMGKAFASVANDGSALYWNAAGIGEIRQAQASLMRAYLYEGLAYYDFATYIQPLPNNVTIGVGWTRLTIEDIPVFDENEMINTDVFQRIANLNLQLSGEPIRSFTSTDDVFQFSFSKHFFKELDFGWLFFKVPMAFNIGGSVKYIKRDLDDILGNGVGFDLSILTKTSLATLLDIDWLGTLNTGVNFQNIGGTSISWDTVNNHSDEILMDTRFGVSWEQPIERFNSSVIFAYDKLFSYNNNNFYGFEYRYDKKIFLRLGLADGDFTTGASYHFYKFYIDYAFVENVLGYSNRVGLRMNF